MTPKTLTTGSKAPRFPISKNWQAHVENAVGELQDEVWGDPERQVVGLKDRLRDQEMFTLEMRGTTRLIKGIAVGFGVQVFGFLIWLANQLHIGQ